jgi:hypothetical protein
MNFPHIIRHSLTLAGIGAAFTAASAQAGTLSFSSQSQKAISCNLTINHRSVDDVATEGATSVSINALVSRNATPGRYRIALACSPYKPVIKNVRVKKAKKAHHGNLLAYMYLNRVKPPVAPAATVKAVQAPPPVVTIISASPFDCVTAECPIVPATVQPVITPAALVEATKLWLAWEPSFMKEEFRDGQCTDLAESKRPDIIIHTMEYDIAARITAGDEDPYPQNPFIDWDAEMWDSNAAATGMAVGATPQAGAIMVFHEPNYNHETAPGHVAYVDSVNADGSVTVTQEHAPQLNVVTEGTFSAQQLAHENVDYIY